jgi:ankyrin repeat protein
MTDLDRFLAAAFWKGSTDKADAILARHPEIATASIHAAAVLGDEDTLRRFVDADRASATAKAGPDNHDPLTRLCFSAYFAADRSSSERFVRCARVLLDAGASANTGFFNADHGPAGQFECVLYGAAGVAHDPEMTRLLLERGADPNDDEVVYHSPETLDSRAMKLIVETGRITADNLSMMLARKFDWHDLEGVNWLLDHGTDPNHEGRFPGNALHKALDCGNPLSFFETLLDHGADPTRPGRDGPSAFTAAAITARRDVIDLLAKRGFTIPSVGDDAFLIACARADEAAARRLLAADAALLGRVQSRVPTLLIDFAGAENPDAVRLLLDLGFDVNAARTEPRWRVGETALHVAAWRGRAPTVRLLIDRGAPLEAQIHSGHTPLDLVLLGLSQPSEWTPNDEAPTIARMLLGAGAELHNDHVDLAAAICLDLSDDVARLLPSASARDRQLALAAAAYNGNIPGLETMIGAGVDVNALNPGVLQYAMPLHCAVNSGSLAAVQLLVDAGADTTARDTWYNATPFDWAEWYLRQTATGGETREYAEIVAYLRMRSQ